MLPPAHTRRPSLAAQSGQSIVEFVLVLPFLLVLLFGIVDFGMAVNSQSDLNQVAANTARRLAVNANSGLNPVTEAKADLDGTLPSTVTVDVSLPDGATPGNDRAVCVKLTATRTIQIIPGFEGIGPTLNLSGKAAMRLEMPANWSGYATAVNKTSACT